MKATGLLLSLALAPAPPPAGPLQVTTSPGGDALILRVQGRGPALLDLSISPVGAAPDQARVLADRRILPDGTASLDLAPPEAGEYAYEMRLEELGFSPAVPVGHRGTGPGRFRGPTFLALTGRDDVAVADAGNARVQVLDAGGRFRFTLEPRDARGGRLEPAGMTVSRGRTLLVADARGGGLLRFNQDGRPVEGVEPAEPLPSPGGLAELPSGDLVVCEPRRGSLAVLDRAGRPRRRLGGFGGGGVLLDRPTDVAAHSDALWVVEAGAARVSRVDLAGRRVRAHAGGLARPHGLAVGPDGLLYVADPGSRAVHVFDPDAGELLRLHATAAARTSLGEPMDVVALPSGDLVVSDRRRGHLWRFPRDSTVTVQRGQVSLRPRR